MKAFYKKYKERIQELVVIGVVMYAAIIAVLIHNGIIVL